MGGGKKRRSRALRISGPMHGHCMAIDCTYIGRAPSRYGGYVPVGLISNFRVISVFPFTVIFHWSRFQRGHYRRPIGADGLTQRLAQIEYNTSNRFKVLQTR